MSERKAEYKAGELSKFRPQRKNANRHTQRGQAMLEMSLQSDGWIDAQTAAANGEMISGSLRLEVAADKFADVEPIIVETDGTRPVIIKRTDIPSADDPRARRLSIAANQISAADWNPDGELLAEWAGEDEQIKRMFADSEWMAIEARTTGPAFREYDENIADGVEVCKCSTCGHEHAKKNN